MYSHIHKHCMRTHVSFHHMRAAHLPQPPPRHHHHPRSAPATAIGHAPSSPISIPAHKPRIPPPPQPQPLHSTSTGAEGGLDPYSSIHFVPTRREISAWIADIMSLHGVAVDARGGSLPRLTFDHSHNACDVHHSLRYRHTSSSSSSISPEEAEAAAMEAAMEAAKQDYTKQRAMAKMLARRDAVCKAEDTARALRVKLGSKAPPARLQSAVPTYDGGGAIKPFSHAECRATCKALSERLRASQADLAMLREKIRVLHEIKQLTRARMHRQPGGLAKDD